MIFIIICVLAITSAITGVATFILFIRARMQEDVVNEERFKKIHYIALTLLLLLVITALNLYEEPN
ncbi:MAG: hypothetical protein HYX40_11175 [Sphingobacteriales bacterium]|nr:hypothetical protein [Sphingobacteriales bacterium]